MPKRSAAILLYRCGVSSLEVLAVHPGGPYWAKKDLGSWSLPKGEYEEGEAPLAAAVREFTEELGSPPPEGPRLDLGEVKLASGKLVTAWAIEGDFDVSRLKCETFEMEWPPRSGQVREFPEVDRAEWFTISSARSKLNPAQGAFLDQLLTVLRD